MSVLAFKALGYGAEQIPDKFFEKIPGGFFTPSEKKDIDKGRKDRKDRKDRKEQRHRSEQRPSRRDSGRDHAPPSDYSDDSASDSSDYEREREQRKKERRRAKSVGRSSSRSLSRGRHHRSSSHVDGEYGDLRDMAEAEQGGAYRPYGAGDYRAASAMPAYGYQQQPAASHQDRRQSSSAARYTPGPGYAPSPPVDAPIPPPPVGAHSPNAPYAPYNPADYPPMSGAYRAPASGNTYPSPPPFERQRSSSQPSFDPAYPAYPPPASAQQQLLPYDASPRRDSTKPRREHRHRARSVDSHSTRSRKSNQHRDDSRMAKVRGRFDSMDARERGLAATVGGALAGGLAGHQLGKSRLTALAGAAAGALSGRVIQDKRSKSRGEPRSHSRSRSRSRSRARSGERSRPHGIRARSKSIVDRLRSKSRGPAEEDRDAARHYKERPDRDRRPDRGYDADRRYDSYSESDDDAGSRRRRRRSRH